MTWQPNKRTGWTKSRDEHTSRLSQVIRTVLEVVPGGVIRAGKAAYADPTAGFWLGIDGDGLAKFHVGNATYYLRWTGLALEVAHVITGAVRVSGGVIEWAGGKGRADDAGIQHVETSQRYWEVKPASDRFMRVFGGNNYPGSAIETYSEGGIALYAESSTGIAVEGQCAGGVAILGFSDLVGVEGYGTGIGVLGVAQDPAGVALKAVAGDGARALAIEGGVVDGGLQRYTQLGDPVNDADALNRRTGDGRYLRKSAGWTGSFVAGGLTVMVMDGQIVGVG